MVQPHIWGPFLWEMLFVCTWNCPERKFSSLERLIHLTASLLPCTKCRDHFQSKRGKVNRRAKGAPSSPKEMLYWLYCMKDEVNNVQKRRSIPFTDFSERLCMFGSAFDEVRLGDTLVLVALYSKHKLASESDMADLCHLLSDMLPLADDSELRTHLDSVQPTSLVSDVTRAARAARIEKGLKTFGIAHYKVFADLEH